MSICCCKISDFHLGTKQPRAVEALVGFAAQQRPDMVVPSNDIMQRTRPRRHKNAEVSTARIDPVT